MSPGRRRRPGPRGKGGPAGREAPPTGAHGSPEEAPGLTWLPDAPRPSLRCCMAVPVGVSLLRSSNSAFPESQ